MMKRAFAGTDYEELSQHLEGTNALAVSATDATAPARILAKYAKQFPALELIAGVVEGNYNDQAGIQALSQSSVQRRTSWKTSWKYPVSYYQLCSCA